MTAGAGTAPRAAITPYDLIPSLLSASDVLGAGWFAADLASVKLCAAVVVVGDGAVALLGVLSAKQLGAERIIAMIRHEPRQKLAREFGTHLAVWTTSRRSTHESKGDNHATAHTR